MGRRILHIFKDSGNVEEVRGSAAEVNRAERAAISRGETCGSWGEGQGTKTPNGERMPGVGYAPGARVTRRR